MRVVVTGAGGFIGSHVTEQLLAEGHSVCALTHYRSDGGQGHLHEVPQIHQDRLEIKPGDITDSFLVRDLVADCDAVLHLAALIGIPYSYVAPASYIDTNLRGTLNVLEACRQARIGRLIVTSTSEVYGTARYTPIDEEHPLQAQSPYSASKIAADKLAESYFRSFDLPVVTLRPFNTFGPRQSARAIIPTVLTQALSGAETITLGNLAPQRDLTYATDTANAFVLATTASGIEGEVIHFGQGAAVSIGELAERCLRTVGSDARVVTSKDRERPAKSEVDLLLCDPTKARKKLDWKPAVDLDEGIQRTADYLRRNLDRFQDRGYVI